MPRPPYFREDTPKVVEFLKKLLEFHDGKSTEISLKYMVTRVRADFPKYFPKVVYKPNATKAEKIEADKKEVDRVRHIIFKLAKKHDISWFSNAA